MYRTTGSAEAKEDIDRHQKQEWVYLEDRRKIVISISSKLEYKIGPMVTYETSKIPYIYSRKDHISEIRDSLLRIMGEIRNNFEDFRDRQMWFFKLKKVLESARKESQDNPVLLELIVCLFDTVKNSYSENLTAEHIAALETIIQHIDKRITEADVDEATEKLISAGLNPLPKLDGLAEIYKRSRDLQCYRNIHVWKRWRKELNKCNSGEKKKDSNLFLRELRQMILPCMKRRLD